MYTNGQKVLCDKIFFFFPHHTIILINTRAQNRALAINHCIFFSKILDVTIKTVTQMTRR